MTRKSSTTKITVLSPEAAAVEANKFIPREAFQQLSFWGKLNRREQEAIYREGNQLNAVMIINASSNLAIGERFTHIHEVLKPHKGAFAKLTRRFNKSERSAYRYMNEYEAALERVHGQEHVLHAAMARGMNLPGKYGEAMTKYPPPRNLTEEGANRYLDQVVKTRKEIVQGRKEGTVEAAPATEVVKKDPRVALMQSFRLAKNSMREMSSKQKTRFFEDMVGMLMTHRGIGSAKTFDPVAIPEEFNQGRGRPSKQEEGETIHEL